MEALKLNLSRNEFSTGRKILLWILGTLFLTGALWSLYVRLAKIDESAEPGLILVLFLISAFIYFIALLATVQKKSHFFHVDEDMISYRYGFFFPGYHKHKWEDISEIIMKYDQRTAMLILNNGKHISINLKWIQKSSSQLILKHIYYTAQNKNLPVIRNKKK
ncbi:MAG: hypothetical protein KFF49_00840 [Bacteroidales bacterium]|nr:hypothetical protein [Bacteroidales bacterium]